MRWAVLSLIVVVASPARADEPGWSLISDPAAGPERSQQTAIHDPVRDQMLIFGGGSGALSNDVWAMPLGGKAAWSKVPAAGAAPNARMDHTTIYDPLGDRMLVFGGNDLLGDLWGLALSGTPAWTPLAPGPAARAAHSAIYDPVRQRMLVFGGYGSGGSAFNDVWAYSVTTATWSAIAVTGTPPSTRWNACALYDAARDRMVVVGGTVPGIGDVMDVWELSLSGSPVWTPVVTSGTAPAPRTEHVAVLDAAGDRVLLHGGWVSAATDPANPGRRGDLWQLSLAGMPAWTPLSPGSAPAPRSSASGIYDPARERLLLFGGTGDSGITDECLELPLSGKLAWARVSPAAPPTDPAPRSGYTVVHDPIRGRLLFLGGLYLRATDPDLWALPLDGVSGWTPIYTTGNGPWRGITGHSAVFDDAGDRMVVFGGTGNQSTAWALSFEPDAVWTTLPGGPPGRSLHSATCDPPRQRMIVYGGRVEQVHNNHSVSDVWALSLGEPPSWTLLGAGPTPQGSFRHTAFYDPVRDRLVVAGGSSQQGGAIAQGYGNRTWTMSLEGPPAWQELAITGSPPGVIHQMAYNAERDRILALGGPGPGSDGIWFRPATDDGAWAPLATVGTQPLLSSPLVFDPQGDRLLLGFTGPAGAAPDELDQAWGLSFGSTVSAGPQEPGALSLAVRANPVTGEMNVSFTLAGGEPTRLALLDVAGREAASRAFPAPAPGPHVVRLGETGRLAPGVYFLRLSQAHRAITKRIVVIR